MKKIKTVIVGAGQKGNTVYCRLKHIDRLEITGVADLDTTAPGMVAARKDNVFTSTDFKEVVTLPETDVIIVTTDDPGIQHALYETKNSSSSLMEPKAVDLVMASIKEKEELLEFKRIQGELSAILNSVQEAIEVTDNQGIIKYVNPAFSRITGIPEEERIGQNIFQVAPNGALVLALRTGKPVFGYRTIEGGSNAEVIYNASPIIVDHKMEGGVVVFQHITDVMKLIEELKRSTTIIENLTDKLRQVASSKYQFSDILGESSTLNHALSLAQKAAQSNSTVLLLGESGTGKELFAHAIHATSLRSDKPFIKVNCAAIPETLLESEFFGYAKGAFTGAVKAKIGKFELANGGTIFLDEIGDMSLLLQAKLLRVLQEMEFEPLGATRTTKVDVRVIAASNRNLREMIRQGKFREDLYYRLNVLEITIPPLRARKKDLPILVKNLIVELNKKLGKRVKGLAHEAEELLFNYDWPGNVRELENVIERIMVTIDEEIIGHKHLLRQLNNYRSTAENEIKLMPLEQAEQMLVKKALATFGHNVEGKRKAAQVLNISLATLYNKLKKWNYRT